jgi:hypothetical protein
MEINFTLNYDEVVFPAREDARGAGLFLVKCNLESLPVARTRTNEAFLRERIFKF